jgi:hypothetical protein
MPRSADAAQRAVTFLQHYILYVTRYQSRAAGAHVWRELWQK